MGSTSGPTRRRDWSRPPRVAAARRLAGGRALGVRRGSEVHNTYLSLTCRLRVRRARAPHVLCCLYAAAVPPPTPPPNTNHNPPPAKTARLCAHGQGGERGSTPCGVSTSSGDVAKSV